MVCKSDLNNFVIDGITYRPPFNELGEIGGCYDPQGEFEACEDCIYEGQCPGQFDEEDE